MVKDFRHLAHWGRVTHICVGNLTTIGSCNGFRDIVNWTQRTNFDHIAIEMHIFPFKKTHLKISSGNGGHFVSASMSWSSGCCSQLLDTKHTLSKMDRYDISSNSSLHVLVRFDSESRHSLAMPTQWGRGSTRVGRTEPQTLGTLRVKIDLDRDGGRYGWNQCHGNYPLIYNSANGIYMSIYLHTCMSFMHLPEGKGLNSVYCQSTFQDEHTHFRNEKTCTR